MVGLNHHSVPITIREKAAITGVRLRDFEIMTWTIVVKILKEPIHSLKANIHRNIDYAEIVRGLFRLDVEKGK